VDNESSNSWKKFRKLRPSSKKLRTKARSLENVSLKHAHKFIIARMDSIRSVKRHAIGWLAVVGLLIAVSAFQLLGYQRSYSSYAPIAGGTYAEGVIGPLETMNPIFARSPAEQSASRLIFSGLLSYDMVSELRGDLAKSWTVQDDGKKYIVVLKEGITWHDGTPVTADDVVYTVSMIKNPLVRSPLYNSWSQIKVAKVADDTVSFELMRPYAAFPHALTFGILPKHILGDSAPERLRENEFNRDPIGTGPFKFSRLQVIDPDQGRLIAYFDQNEQYVFGAPRLDRFQLNVFQDSAAVAKSFQMQEINAAVDVSSDQILEITTQRPAAIVYKTLLADGMFAFLNNDVPEFSDPQVRKAFVAGTDRTEIIDRLHGFASRLEGPLVANQLPSALDKRQATFDLAGANQALDKAGWVTQNNVRVKDGVQLEIDLVGVNSGDYPVIVDELKQQWERLGAKVTTRLVEPTDVQQTVLLPRSYDAFVYELELGIDPDVFAYWHVSQADPRGLNLSNYKSTIASEALASAQLRSERALRVPKYDLFVDTWLQDSPAVALYQPQLHYVTSSETEALQSANTLVNRADRYRSIEEWTINRDWKYTSP